MSSKRPKGTFQDLYNKPDSAIPPFMKGLFYMVLIQIQESLEIKKGSCADILLKKKYAQSHFENIKYDNKLEPGEEPYLLS